MAETFQDDEKRVARILNRLKSCEEYTAAAKSQLSSRRDGNDIRAWVTNVRFALRRCGLVGTTVMVYRLTRQRKSQSNSWEMIARQLGLTVAEAKLIHRIAVTWLLAEMARREIPDDYTEEYLAAA